MKNILILLMVLCATTLTAQKFKTGTEIGLGTLNINTTQQAVPGAINALDILAMESRLREEIETEYLSKVQAACDERQLAIEKMKLEIDCRGISPDELGIPPDTVYVCDDLGIYSEWIVAYCDRNMRFGSHLAWLEPATPRTSGQSPSGTARSHTLVGLNRYVPVGTRIVMAIK